MTRKSGKVRHSRRYLTERRLDALERREKDAEVYQSELNRLRRMRKKGRLESEDSLKFFEDKLQKARVDITNLKAKLENKTKRRSWS